MSALPVLTYSTGLGWFSVGRASSVEAARRVVLRVLDASSRSLLDRHGFQLTVFRRTELQRELNGGPDGYVWALGKAVKTAASTSRQRIGKVPASLEG